MRVQVGDVRLFVDVDGEALAPEGSTMRERPVIVLVHGGPGTNDHSHYKPFFRSLTDIAQLVYYDHRGNGRSDRSSPERWSLTQWAEDLRALLEVLGLQRPIVLGTSFGGFVAQEFAIRYSHEIAGLILCSTASRIRFDRVGATMERLGGRRAREVSDRFWLDSSEAPRSPNHALHPAMQDYIDVCCPLYARSVPLNMDIHTRTQVQADVMFHWKNGELRRVNLLPQLAHVACRTLILAGEDDPITTIEDARDTFDALPEGIARLISIPNAGHPTYQDDPVRSFDEMRKFVLEIEAS